MLLVIHDDIPISEEHPMESGHANGESGYNYFQPSMRYNHCYGCGTNNSNGLRINSRWDSSDPSVSICEFTPAAHHCAGPPDIVNGGIIASLIDCHAICSAAADGYRRAGREIDDDAGEPIIYATGSLQVSYKAPSRLDGVLTVRARIVDTADRRTKFEVTVQDGSGQVTAEGQVTAVQVPGAQWANPDGIFLND
jgi:acyl-coenzyme A thioesterase PaaI-like protein|tara:strand:+ start:1188 stop:1772 length:585 start_codon:yes stop_codon:yes gene_type:complete